MRVTTAFSLVLVGLCACGTADVYNGNGTIQGFASTGGTGNPGSTGSATTGGTTGAPIGGTTGTTTGTTTGMNPNVMDPNTMDPNGVLQNPNNPTTNPNNPNNPNTVNPNSTLPTNAFFTVQNGEGNNGVAMFVLVLSSRPDYCSVISQTNAPANSTNVRVEVQSFNAISPQMYQANSATQDVLDKHCNDMSNPAMPAAVNLQTLSGNSATGQVAVTLQGQAMNENFAAQRCDALGQQDNIVQILLGGKGNCQP